ncbi:MAG TPA: ABC transporter permease [Gemmatimonadaceae bacterium]|nr:ABC transporter permease [Gemmatimonadaceae bacterium]
MDTLLRDIRYALRTLRKSPGFTVFAVLTIALGIGATTTIFGVVDGVLLSPLPYREPATLVGVHETDPGAGNDAFPTTPATFLDWRKETRSFTAMAASRNQAATLTGDGEPQRVPGGAVSAGFFEVLGVRPIIGRGFTAEEDAAGAGQVVVLSEGLWRERFGGDRAVVGRTMNVNGRPYTIVGVMPASLRLPSADTELWVPLAFSAEEASARGSHHLQVVARLAPGATLEQANAELRTIAARMQREYPEFQSGFGAAARPLSTDIVGDVGRPLWVLAGAVGFLLLICCANVANLMLARAASRRKEIAIRSAIGAGRGHIVRQLLAESLVLSLIGGGAGLVLAAWGTDLLVALGPAELPRLQEIGVDARVAAFALAASLVTGALFGIAPAVHASRSDLNDTLKDGTKGSSGGPGRARARQALLVAEVAISLTLLVGAGLMMKSLNRLRAVDPGFRTTGILTAQLPLPLARYDSTYKRMALYQALEERARAIPGVRSVGFTSGVPLSGSTAILGYWIEGKTPRNDNSQVPTATFYQVAGDYFQTMGIPLRKGRYLGAGDRADAPRAAVVNETLARQQFAGEDPIGKRFQIGPDSAPYYTIVGVVGDSRHQGLGAEPPPQLYVPFAQEGFGNLSLVVHAEGDPTRLIASLRGELQALDPDLPLARARTMDDVIAEGIARPRFITLLLGAFAGIALVLALVGTYGVVAYTVAQRTQEFGIRMALGADARRVLVDVVMHAARVTAIGIVVGVAAALVLSRGLATLLFQVHVTDPVTYAVIAALLLGVTVLASWIPARRATRVTPLNALRAE